MIKENPKLTGKIKYYNKITGIIVSNGQRIPFHKKDFKTVFEDNLSNIIDREVKFNVENDEYITYARNIELPENNMFEDLKEEKTKKV